MQAGHINQVFSKAFIKLNPVFSSPLTVKGQHSSFEEVTNDNRNMTLRERVWLRETNPPMKAGLPLPW